MLTSQISFCLRVAVGESDADSSKAIFKPMVLAHKARANRADEDDPDAVVTSSPCMFFVVHP